MRCQIGAREVREEQPKDGQKCNLVVVNQLGNQERLEGFTYRSESDGWVKPFFEPSPFGSARLGKLKGATFFERTNLSGSINPDLIGWEIAS
jgi:hypothetical protein